MKRALTALSLVVASGCGLLGDDSPGLHRIRGGGTGPFRALTTEDTMLGLPASRIATNVGLGDPLYGVTTIGRIAWNDAGCYVSIATLTSPLPVRDPGVPTSEPDLGQYEPSRIAICDASGTAITTTVGADVLAPTEAWEGADLRDPWPVRLADGTIRLYYAADGGIGLAESSAPEGPFVRVGGPIVSPIDAGHRLRSPTVIEGPSGGYLMYFDDGSDIFVATSDDGVSFTRVDLDESTPATDPIALSPAFEGETTRLRPGALLFPTVGGRHIVRLYFDVAANDKANICMAGSFDGLSFERVPTAVFTLRNVGAAVPRILPGGATMLSLTQTVYENQIGSRVPVGAIAPIYTTFDAGL